MKQQTNNITEYQQTELGIIPKEWEVVRLGEVADYYLGRTPPRNEKLSWENGVFPWVSIADMRENKIITYTTEKISKYALEKYFKNKISMKDTLLMSFKLTIGRTSILGINAVHNEAIISIFPQKNLDKMFMFYYLPTVNYSNYMDKAVKGNTLNKSKIDKILIPLPPLSEQKAIAAVLSAIQEAKEKTEAVIAATKELKKSMMKHLFTYGPVSLKEIDKVELKQTELGPLPKEWEVVRLGEVAETYSGGTPSRLMKEFFNGTIGWLKSGELKDNFIFSSEEYISEEALKNSSAKYVIPNTLLIAMYGATAGKVGLVKAKLTINQAICAIVPKNEEFNSSFYFYYFQSIRDNLLSQRFGGAQPNLNQQIIKNNKIPLPPLPIQQKIASILSAIDAKIEAEVNKKKALEALSKSMLHHLMTGKVRVNNLNLEVVNG